MVTPPDPALAEALAEGRRSARLLTYEALAAVTALHRAAPPGPEEAARLRRMPLTGWERSVFSQWGEDGVLVSCCGASA